MEAGIHLRHSDESEASTKDAKKSIARTAVTESRATKSIRSLVVASPGRACKQLGIAEYSVSVKQARERFWVVFSWSLAKKLRGL